jgi:N-acetylneuraminic acid mutarotase
VGLSRGLTNANGRVLLEVMRNKVVRVKVGDGSKEVNTGSAAVSCQGQVNAAGKQGLEKANLEPEVEPTSVTIQVGAPLCVPGARMSCGYNGPEEKRGKGICQAAQRSCNAEGMAWGECVGEVLPQVEEVCTSGLDDDCDGTINEGCAPVCEEGETRRCDGPPDVGQCRAGTQTCVAGGMAWSACEGQVLPEPEDCSRPGDEDCDGTTCECWPGQSQQCPYTGKPGTEGQGECKAGTRTCEASVTGGKWSSCQGEVTDRAESCANTLDDDCNGQVNDAPECVCMPNSIQNCYSGPAGTQGVGVCRDGTQTCEASGTAWGACTGEVLPLPEEDCTTAGDDDCDGEVNEGTVCLCAPGTSRSCYSGPAGTQGVGMCRAGSQTCNTSGTAWGACNNEYTPQLESCTSPLGDEDCDGQRNEACGWVETTSMGTTRSNHSAVVLSNGLVLVMGGVNLSGEALDTAKVYDPATATWAGVSNMLWKRKGLGAVLLNNGRVLAVGGWNLSQVNTAELYDPATNKWTAAKDMGSARDLHTTTRLSDGRVLVSGGANTSGHLDAAEVYDPATDTWAATTNTMEAKRAMHAATLLNNGQVLVTGGHLSDKTRLNSAEVYTPATNTWTAVKPMTYARTGHTSTLLSNGQVLVAGGAGDGPHVTSAEVYDPMNDKWTTIADPSGARDEHRAVLLPNGHVLVSGGDNGATATATAEVYDPGNKTWTPAASMNAARTAHTMVLLGTGEVLVLGGSGTIQYSGALTTAEVYNPLP